MTDENQLKKIIAGVRLLGIEKRYVPNKHYLYILSVKWSEGSEFIIYRRYSAFFQLHEKLTELFPIETGVVSKKDQKIPPLPKQRWFGNEKFKVAERRQTTIDEYCRKVAMAEPKISEHEEVLSFFEALPEDLTPPPPDPEMPNKTYLTFESKNKRGNGKKEKTGLRHILHFLTGTSEEIVSSGDEMEISAPILLETYRAIATFSPSGKTEVRLEEGAHVDVVEKNMSGWWLVQVDEKQGWCPASYLEPLDQPEERDEERPNWEGEEFLTTEQYEAQIDDEIGFDKGVVVHVIHKLLDGWWVVRYNDKVGYAPCAYLEKYTNPHLTLNKARARIGSDTTTGSFIKKLPPRRSTIRKKSTAHKKAQKQRDLQMYRRKTLEASKRSKLGASKGSSQLEVARENYKRLSQLAETEESESAETYMDMTGSAATNTDAEGYLLPSDSVKSSGHTYVNESVIEEISGRKSNTSSTSSAEDGKATESRHAYVNEEVLAQGTVSSAGNIYVNEESLPQAHGDETGSPADDVWTPAFVSPASMSSNTGKKTNNDPTDASVWTPAFVDEEKSKKEFPANPSYINSDTVASAAGKSKVKNTQFMNLGYVPDAPVPSDSWNPTGPNANNNASSDPAYKNIDVPNNRVSGGTTRPQPVPSPRARRNPVPAPRGTTPSLLLPEGNSDSSGSNSPKSGRSTPKSGRSSPRSGRLSPGIPTRPTAAQIAAKCSPQTKLKILQAQQAPSPDTCVVNDTKEREPINEGPKECPVSPSSSDHADAAVIDQITAMIGKSSPNISPANQRRNYKETAELEENRKSKVSLVISQEEDVKDTEKPGDEKKTSFRVIKYDGPATMV
ncbi:pneumococcal serine-rich repeat protein-like isoform X2 [Branchiostoma lanceolatum]|uniref:pneumococcal serine-rich repeat protein-like isoform X2 n=1 Tax=Branchiostoma lanceolatum TaxID=7740 RepID=UPI0034533F81